MKPHFVAMAANCDLTLQQAIALEVLGPERSRSMSEIAETIACDASSATAIVDRLEARGLVERRSAEHDRRVKTVVLTPRGEELRVRFEATDPPPEILRLSDGDLVELCRLFRSMLGR
ncbi:MAG: MarR family winged helix-turn-helix transcriptional regulator [Vulcanimicrobiaceae bacterium]